MNPHLTRRSDLKRPDLQECPHVFCAHWVEVRWGNVQRGRCTCEFGTCSRSGEEGDKDFYEPNDQELRMHGLPWFFYMDPEELRPEQRVKYTKYFSKVHHQLLKPGASGLRGVKTNGRLVNGNQFMEQCYCMAEQLGARVSDTDLNTKAKSFIWVSIRDIPAECSEQEQIYVLHHSLLPLMACATKIAPYDLMMIDPLEKWRSHESVSTWIDAAPLNEGLNNDHLTALSETERALIRRWRPKTVADVLFNWWDIERMS